MRELDELIRKATARFDSMPPEQQAKLRERQRISFVYGSYKLSNPNSDVTIEDVERISKLMVQKELNALQEKEDQEPSSPLHVRDGQA